MSNTVNNTQTQNTQSNMDTTLNKRPVSKIDILKAFDALISKYKECFNPFYIKVALSCGLSTEDIVKFFAPEKTFTWCDNADFREALSLHLNCRVEDITQRVCAIGHQLSTTNMMNAFGKGAKEFMEYLSPTTIAYNKEDLKFTLSNYRNKKGVPRAIETAPHNCIILATPDGKAPTLRNDYIFSFRQSNEVSQFDTNEGLLAGILHYLKRRKNIELQFDVTGQVRLVKQNCYCFENDTKTTIRVWQKYKKRSRTWFEISIAKY